MEYFDVYNQAGEKLNKKVPRGQTLAKDEYYKVVHLWIKNKHNQYLIQQRNKSTDRHPYQWAPTAGAVQAGETPLQAVVREAKEEIDLDIESSQLHHVKTWIQSNHMGNIILDVYYLETDISLENLSLDLNEVRQVKYASLKDIEEMTKVRQFWNYKLIDQNYYQTLESVKK